MLTRRRIWRCAGPAFVRNVAERTSARPKHPRAVPRLNSPRAEAGARSAFSTRHQTHPHHLIGANSQIKTATVTISQHASSNVTNPTRLRLTCHPATPRQRSAASGTRTNRPKRDPWQASQTPCQPDVKRHPDHERQPRARATAQAAETAVRLARAKREFAAQVPTRLNPHSSFPLGPAPVRTPMKAREQGRLGDGLTPSARPMPPACLRETNQLRWQDEEASESLT